MKSLTSQFSFKAPDKILVVTDGNILQYLSKTEKGYIYKYIQSETKLNTVVEYAEQYLKSMLHYSFKDIGDETVIIEVVIPVVKAAPVVAEKGADSIKAVKPKQSTLF